MEALQPDRDLSRTPLFQVMFVLQNVPMQELQLQGLKLTPISIDTGAVAYDLTLSLSEHEDTLTGWLEYNTGLFKSETIKWMVEHFPHAAAKHRRECGAASLTVVTND